MIYLEVYSPLPLSFPLILSTYVQMPFFSTRLQANHKSPYLRYCSSALIITLPLLLIYYYKRIISVIAITILLTSLRIYKSAAALPALVRPCRHYWHLDTRFCRNRLRIFQYFHDNACASYGLGSFFIHKYYSPLGEYRLNHSRRHSLSIIRRGFQRNSCFIICILL